MISEIKGFAADIDMTLTGKGQSLPEITMQALEVLHKNGVKIGLATGRVIEEKLKEQGKNWGLSFEFDFLVCLNGGQVYDAATKTLSQADMLFSEELEHIMSQFMDLIDKYQITVNAEGGESKACMYINDLLRDAMARHGWYFDDYSGDLKGFCHLPTFKLLFRTTPEYGEMIRQRFNERLADEYQIVSTFPGTLEVMHKGIDKGKGVEKYAEWNGLSMDDFICFGDNENDNEMLKKAGWAVCLRNGSDGTKACADAVTEYDCLDGGVGHYLIDHYLKPKGFMD